MNTLRYALAITEDDDDDYAADNNDNRIPRATQRSLICVTSMSTENNVNIWKFQYRKFLIALFGPDRQM